MNVKFIYHPGRKAQRAARTGLGEESKTKHCEKPTEWVALAWAWNGFSSISSQKIGSIHDVSKETLLSLWEARYIAEAKVWMAHIAIQAGEAGAGTVGRWKRPCCKRLHTCTPSWQRFESCSLPQPRWISNSLSPGNEERLREARPNTFNDVHASSDPQGQFFYKYVLCSLYLSEAHPYLPHGSATSRPQMDELWRRLSVLVGRRPSSVLTGPAWGRKQGRGGARWGRGHRCLLIFLTEPSVAQSSVRIQPAGCLPPKINCHQEEPKKTHYIYIYVFFKTSFGNLWSLLCFPKNLE